MRQRHLCYSIRAGRNLPDKEFRYLRTVIVTAAVYWGLSSPLRPCELTAPLDLPAPGRSQTLYLILRFQQSPVFLLNSHGAPFTAAPMSPWEHPFFRSYGVILPSSLTKSHSRALGFSPHPPVSVYGTVGIAPIYEGFLGSVVRPLSASLPAVVSAFGLTPLRIFLEEHPYRLSPGQPLPGRLTFLRHPLG